MWIHQRACEMNALIYSIVTLAAREMPSAEHRNSPPLSSLLLRWSTGIKRFLHPTLPNPTPPVPPTITLLSSEAERPLLSPSSRPRPGTSLSADSGEREDAAFVPRVSRARLAVPASRLGLGPRSSPPHAPADKGPPPLPTSLTSRAAPALGRGQR